MQRLDALASTALVGQRVDRGRLRRAGYPPSAIDMVMKQISRAAARVRAKALWKRVRDTFRAANVTSWLVNNSDVGRDSDDVHTQVGQIGFNKYGRNTENTLPDQMRKLWMDWGPSTLSGSANNGWISKTEPGYDFNIRGGRARRAVNRYKPY